jgi:hypothetical protein
MSKFYFVLYVCKRIGKIEPNLKNCQVLLKDQHPLEWQLECNEKYQREEYTVLHWQEISSDEFNRFDGHTR